MVRRKWNEEELQFLRENYGVLSLEEIAEKLNRTISSIMHKAKRKVLNQSVNLNKDGQMNRFNTL